MGRISNKLKQLKFAAYCFRKANNARFVKRVEALDKEDNLVSLESYGEKTGYAPVYFIDMEESHSGFFAEHNRLLAMLYFADKYHLKPVVRFHRGYCYAEEHPVNGTDNPFEYYFKQPGGISLTELSEYGCVLKSRKENSNLAIALNEDSNGYSRSEAYLDEMGRITGKYIRLNETVKRKLQADMEKLGINGEFEAKQDDGTGAQTAGCILAVHVRGTDFKQHYNGHPVQVTIEEYLQAAVKLFERGQYTGVFLATDDTDAIAAFQKEFGDKLVFYRDVIRSSGKDTVMHSTVQRENHHYLLGFEVLRDMYTLASCEGLVAGLSQVSYAARIQKKSTGKEYRDLVILNKGINYHQKENCPD